MAQRNRDLWAIVILTGVGLAVQWPGIPAVVRLVGGLALVVLCPGYALTSALFPGRLGWAERALFSLGLSLAVVMLGALVLNGTSAGLQTGVWAGLAAGISVGASLIAVWRRGRADPESAPAHWPQLRVRWTQWTVLGLAGLLTVGALTWVRMPLPTSGVLGYTSLSIVAVGEANSRTIRLAISSDELDTTQYRLRVTFDGLLFLNETDITLKPGENWEKLIVLPEGQPVGTVEAVLFRNNTPNIIYRRVTLQRGPPPGQ